MEGLTGKAPPVKVALCEHCGCVTLRGPHDLRVCVHVLSRRLKTSERELEVAEGTVSWLRKRWGGPDEE